MSDQPITSLNELRRSYNRRYKEDPITAPDAEYRWVLSHLRPVSGKTLLDIACGGGHLLMQAKRAGLIPFGCDIADQALMLARQNVRNAGVLLCDGEYLPFANDQFDYVTNLGSLEHFLSPEQGIREMARVVKSGGVVAVLLPNSYRLYEILHVWRTGYASPQNQELERFASVNEWRDLLQANGLRVIKTYAVNTFQTTWKWRLVRLIAPFNLAQVFLYICAKSM